MLAKKQMHIYKAPKVLVLCLKRFKRKGEYYQEKFNMYSPLHLVSSTSPLRDLISRPSYSAKDYQKTTSKRTSSSTMDCKAEK